MENLDKILNHILVRVAEARKTDSDKKVVIQLFGGEPFQAVNKEVNRRIFEFARTHKFYVSATSNGIEIDEHLDLLATYHGYMSTVGITLDGDRASHDGIRRYKKGAANFDRIVKNINILLKLNIPVLVGMNICRQNFDKIEGFLDACDENGWSNHPKVTIDFGRVDDRKYETSEEGRKAVVLMEAELLEALLRLNALRPFPKNIQFAFLKTTLKLCQQRAD